MCHVCKQAGPIVRIRHSGIKHSGVGVVNTRVAGQDAITVSSAQHSLSAVSRHANSCSDIFSAPVTQHPILSSRLPKDPLRRHGAATLCGLAMMATLLQIDFQSTAECAGRTVVGWRREPTCETETRGVSGCADSTRQACSTEQKNTRATCVKV